jgi:hypothetical protein
MGVLVLTSTQDDPFADDVLETLQFVASIVSNFVSSFEECYTHSNRFKAVKAAIPLLDGDAKARLAEAFDIEVQESQVTESEDDYTQ